MAKSVPFVRLFVLAAALVAVSWAALPAHGQDDRATLSVDAPKSVSASADHVDVNINVANAKDLAGFQFVLTVDQSMLKPLSVKQTTFLAQSGREIFCGDPTIEAAAVRFSCVTLRLTPAGVDGDGPVATVSLQPLHSGTATLELSHVELVRPDGSTLPSAAVNGSLKLSGSGGTTWWPYAAGGGGAVIVLAAAGAVLLMRRRPAQTVVEQERLPDDTSFGV